MDVFGLIRVIAENEPKMKILFYLSHPGHFHLFKNIIFNLKINHNVTITIKKKDVLEELVKVSNTNYINILPTGRVGSKFGLTKGLIYRLYRHYKLCKKTKYDIVISSAGEMGIVTKILGIPFINIFEDDLTLFPNYSKLVIPFVDTLLVPTSCNTVNWARKTVYYKGNQELAYLHPSYFKPDKTIARKYLKFDKRNFVIRFSKLDAWHDDGKTGISDSVLEKILSILQPHGNIIFTSEIVLKGKYEKYQLKIPVSEIHHILYFCDLYIGDSQTMTAEAAVLGTPAIRFNDFVGKIGYLEELENYKLAFGIETNNVEKLLLTIKEILEDTNLNENFRIKRETFLNEKIDVTAFMLWFIENYPMSITTYRKNPEIQENFK